MSVIFLVFLSLATVEGCIESERRALLTFKRDVIDYANRLGSWSPDHGDCCGWDGVVCDNVTGHVLELHLGNPQHVLDDCASTSKFEAIERSKLRGEEKLLIHGMWQVSARTDKFSLLAVRTEPRPWKQVFNPYQLDQPVGFPYLVG